jgi:hypothetical protein
MDMQNKAIKKVLILIDLGIGLKVKKKISSQTKIY